MRIRWVTFLLVVTLVWCCGLVAGQGTARADAGPVQDDTPAEHHADQHVPDRTITLNLNNTPLRDLLNMVAQRSGQQFIVADNARDVTVTTFLSDVPLEAALDAVFSVYDLNRQVLEGNIVVVSRLAPQPVEDAGPPALQMQMFKLQYRDAEDMKQTLKPLLSSRGRIQEVFMSRHPGWDEQSARFISGMGSHSGRAGLASQDNRRLVDRDEVPRRVVRSRDLIVMDTPENLDLIRQIVEAVDRRPVQVRISARLVEVSREKLLDLGTEWSVGTNHGRGTVEVGSSLLPNLTDGLSLGVNHLSRVQFEFMLRALEEDADANVLSSPSIMTLDGHEANILVGERYPIVQSTASSGTNNVALITQTLSYFQDIGIQLSVIPRVQANDDIALIVQPTVSERTGVVTLQSTAADGTVAETELPIISTRETQTEAFVNSGQTVVIGGLLKDMRRETIGGTPLLKDLPLVGLLFQRNETRHEKVELLIFLTATVVDSPEVANQVPGEFDDSVINPARQQRLEQAPASRPKSPGNQQARPHAGWGRSM